MSYKGNRNRKYEIFKKYNILEMEDMYNLSKDIVKLSMLSARMDIKINQEYAIVHVFCRTNGSKVFKKCVELGFKLF